MRKKLVFLITISMLMVNTAFVFGINSNNLKTTSAGVDAPVWEVGDYWKYNLDISGSQGEFLEFDLSMRDLTFTVEQVLGDKYKVRISAPRGNVQGSGTLKLSFIKVDGSLSNGQLDGYLYINKSDLGMVNEEGYLPDISLSGNIGNKAFNVDIDMELDAIFTSLMFPLDVGNEWTVESNVFTLHYSAQYGIFTFNDRSKPDDDIFPLWLVVDEHDMICTKMGLVTVPFGSYKDSYELQWKDDADQVIWYSPDAKNIVKAELSNLDLLMFIEQFSMELVDSTYGPPNDPPETPDTPSGETNGYQHVEYTYETSAEDPNFHDVQYGFDWGDGSDITWTTFVSSGSTASASHIYTSDGTYEIKVKAQDQKGAESDWSEPLAVSIAPNSRPDKPDKPDGPTAGDKGTAYPYTTSTSDADGDQIYYWFDWGDGSNSGWLGPYDSDVEVSKDNSWSKGNYQIKVKAKDEHGAKSEWSDPLSVSMPRNRLLNLRFTQILRVFLDRFPLLEKLVSL